MAVDGQEVGKRGGTNDPGTKEEKGGAEGLDKV